MSNDRRCSASDLVERYFGSFLSAISKAGPNSAIADNMRRAAEAMIIADRCSGSEPAPAEAAAVESRHR